MLEITLENIILGVVQSLQAHKILILGNQRSIVAFRRQHKPIFKTILTSNLHEVQCGLRVGTSIDIQHHSCAQPLLHMGSPSGHAHEPISWRTPAFTNDCHPRIVGALADFSRRRRAQPELSANIVEQVKEVYCRNFPSGEISSLATTILGSTCKFYQLYNEQQHLVGGGAGPCHVRGRGLTPPSTKKSATTQLPCGDGVAAGGVQSGHVHVPLASLPQGQLLQTSCWITPPSLSRLGYIQEFLPSNELTTTNGVYTCAIPHRYHVIVDCLAIRIMR